MLNDVKDFTIFWAAKGLIIIVALLQNVANGVFCVIEKSMPKLVKTQLRQR